ncbi:MAG: APC family permease [Bryobacteraceae bacterium]|nr:APC family permease [Bryobacteraceae bacterium]
MSQTTQAGLRPRLKLAQLVVMGIIMIQPTAPMPLFGVVYNEARGHVVTAILLAMVAMLFTALSYGRMARVYPSAGSAYTYVGRELHPALGFLTGWVMLLDYVLNPLICVIWCSKAAANVVSGVPFAVWAVVFAGTFTLLNVRRIEASARTNAMLAGAMGVVIVAMLWASAKFLPGADLTRPFYDPSTFAWGSFSTGASLAVLTYIGFDGISTLSEEVENPRRNILWGTVLTCLIIGALSAVETYAAQVVWTPGQAFPDVDTAYVHVAGKAGGPWLFQAVNLTLMVATIGSGSGAVMAGARLLYGMGRDGVLPKAFFGALDPKVSVPRNNVLLIGAIALAGAFVLSYQLGAELLNFGAFIGFMGVNLAAVKRHRARMIEWLPALLGFLVCLYLWLSLSWFAKIAGGAWLAAGAIAYTRVHDRARASLDPSGGG